MKKLTKQLRFLFLIIGTINLANAQEIVSTQGTSYSNGTTNLSYTIGEVIIETAPSLTQGFHQTSWNFAGIESHDTDFQAQVFPNPITDELTVETDAYQGSSFRLYDEQGRLILVNTLQETTTKINTQQLAAGQYSLQLLKNNTPLKTFKLVKAAAMDN